MFVSAIKFLPHKDEKTNRARWRDLSFSFTKTIFLEIEQRDFRGFEFFFAQNAFLAQAGEPFQLAHYIFFIFSGRFCAV